ncbi:hypothetical protein D0Y83_08310 [Qipengyuania flava]|uniref:Uncharacterized protein n=1 Tax=Qipengyuania flava TaxID=192812 RepID=A0A5P6NB93_9SPHN|nr:hypothetical protein [Qipengyuania flava]MCA0889923.1 hypothetical protein [Qipengyuania flava]QFI63272.1 hypothetical protein D0Y83_08310 [Qipengyuania flava]HCS16561.1 hypothetical protein [Erythrobacter sp.]
MSFLLNSVLTAIMPPQQTAPAAPVAEPTPAPAQSAPSPAFSEPGVTYQPSAPAEDPVTYTAPQQGANGSATAQGATTTTSAASAVAVASSAASDPAAPYMSITDRVAASRAANAVAPRESVATQTAPTDVAALMAAYVQQFDTNEYQSVKQLLG